MALFESGTVDLVKLSLDVASMRQQVLSNNIANWRSEGYTPARVNFEQQLTALQSQVRSGYVADASVAEQVQNLQPYVENDPSAVRTAADDPLALDAEVSEMAKNVLHYQALLTALGKRGSLLKLAINGER